MSKHIIETETDYKRMMNDSMHTHKQEWNLPNFSRQSQMCGKVQECSKITPVSALYLITLSYLTWPDLTWLLY